MVPANSNQLVVIARIVDDGVSQRFVVLVCKAESICTCIFSESGCSVWIGLTLCLDAADANRKSGLPNFSGTNCASLRSLPVGERFGFKGSLIFFSVTHQQNCGL